MGPKAHIEGFGYSSAMQERAAAGEIWDYEALDGFIAGPRQYLPGTSMSYAGLRDAQQRANVILYLDSLAENPRRFPRRPSRSIRKQPSKVTPPPKVTPRLRCSKFRFRDQRRTARARRAVERKTTRVWY